MMAVDKAMARCNRMRRTMIEKEAIRIWRLMEDWHGGKPLPKITIVAGRGWGSQYGHAQSAHNRIQVNVDKIQDEYRSRRVWAVLAHELAHCACPPKWKIGNTNRDTHHRDFYHCLRYVWQKRWKCNISFAAVSKWGYSVDHIIERQASRLITWQLPNPVTPIGKDQIKQHGKELQCS